MGFLIRTHRLTQLAAVSDDDWRAGLAAGRAHALHRIDDVHAVDDLPEHYVLSVQPGRDHGAQEKLSTRITHHG